MCKVIFLILSVFSLSAGEIYVDSIGKGEPIIVLHGGPGFHQAYLRPGLDRLAENNQVIYYDQRGCGKSLWEINEKTVSLSTYLEDLENVRKTYAKKKIILVGHSWGGLLAMHYALKHPENVSKLILLNPAPSSSKGFSLFMQEFAKRTAPDKERIKALKESEAYTKGDPKTVAEYNRLVYRHYVYDPKSLDLLHVELTPQEHINCWKVHNLFREHLLLHPFDLAKKLNHLTVPTLIVHGDADIIPFPTIEETQRAIPGASLVVIENCGHFPYIETPEAFFETVESYLKNEVRIQTAK